MGNIEFSLNYINDEILKMNKTNDVYIKFPGRNPQIETLSKLVETDFNILLHGIVPSSGSLLDPSLCDGLKNYSKFIKQTNQKWLSFHSDYRKCFNNENYLETVEKNVSIIKNEFPNLEILFENMPPEDIIEDWSCTSKTFNEILNKFNFDMLLDVSHAIIAAKKFNFSFEEFINQFDLSKVKEIHVSGVGKTSNGMLDDNHDKISHFVYKCLKIALKKCKNVKMITLEYAPVIEYKNNKEKVDKKIYKNQQKMFKKIKEMYLKINKKENN